MELVPCDFRVTTAGTAAVTGSTTTPQEMPDAPPSPPVRVSTIALSVSCKNKYFQTGVPCTQAAEILQSQFRLGHSHVSFAV